MFPFLEYPYIDLVTDWLASVVVHSSVFIPMILLLLEESGLPMPIPGDILIAYLGYQVTLGNISYFLAFFSLLVSVLIGSSILYLISEKYGQSLVLKVGRYIHVDEHKIMIVEEKFRKYGPLVIIFGRHIPGFRVPITVFSGMSKVGYKTFMISTFLSVMLWIPFYLSLGERLGPRTLQLLHAHHIVFIIFFIPFSLVVLSIIYHIFKDALNKNSKISNQENQTLS